MKEIRKKKNSQCLLKNKKIAFSVLYRKEKYFQELLIWKKKKNQSSESIFQIMLSTNLICLEHGVCPVHILNVQHTPIFCPSQFDVLWKKMNHAMHCLEKEIQLYFTTDWKPWNHEITNYFKIQDWICQVCFIKNIETN